MGFQDVVFLTPRLAPHHISSNCGRGYDLGTATGLYTEFNSKNPHGSQLLWAPTRPKVVVGGNPASWSMQN